MASTDLVFRTEGQLAARSYIDTLQTALEQEVAAGTFPETLHNARTDEGNAECDHFFGDGVYARGLLIPAGTCVVGWLHKQARICFVMYGHCRFVNEFDAVEVEGPWIGEFRAGSKTAVYALTDTYWVAVLGTDLKDPKQIVFDVTAESHEEFAQYATQRERLV